MCISCGDEIGARPPAFSDSLETPDHRADLVMQEGSRGGGNVDLTIAGGGCEPVERLDRRFRLAACRAKRREIVLSDEDLRGLVHGGVIEWLADPPYAVHFEHCGSAPGQDTIEIMSADGAEAGIERARNNTAVNNGDRLRAQMKIDRFGDTERIPISRQIEMRDLAARVYAGIRAARASDLYGLAAKRFDCANEVTLNGLSFGLDLPADEGRAVVLDCDAVAGHGGK